VPGAKKSPAIVSFWWVWLIAAATLAGGAWSLLRLRAAAPRVQTLPGYVTSVATVAQEYARFHGKLFQLPEVEQQFQQATARVATGDYASAVALLEMASKQAAVPVIFNNLGVLYAQLNDRSRAINAFRDALARDIAYQPVRFNLERLKGFTAQSADPVSSEIEPNNNSLLANVIAPNKPVEAGISAGTNDVDFFRLTTPPAPRDILAIEIENQSDTLAPILKIYDSDMRLLNWGKGTRQPGESLTQYLAPPPNTTYYLQISGFGSSNGAYILTVRPLKAFDGYEPNDDIFNARRLPVGQSIEANIMDAQDTDYYSFVAPRDGTVTIIVRSRSATLIPALSTFTPEMHSSGFGPDIRTPGAVLRHLMEVEEGRIYYVQVWSQANSSGDYTLTIE